MQYGIFSVMIKKNKVLLWKSLYFSVFKEKTMAKVKEEYQLPVYLFHDGTNYRAYEFFGVHRLKDNTFAFRVWAPNAEAVSVVGDFNGWNEEAHRCLPVSPGIWEAIIDNVHIYDCYKYAIKTKDGRTLMKADPYAVHGLQGLRAFGLPVEGQQMAEGPHAGLCSGKAGEHLRGALRLLEAARGRQFSDLP